MKKIFLIPILLLAIGFAACNDDDSEDMRIELASPLPDSQRTKIYLASATFFWPEIDKAGGYAYALDDSEDYTIIDIADVEIDPGSSLVKLTVSGLSRGNHTLKLYAVGVEGKSFNSAIREVQFSIEPSIPPLTSISYTIGEAANEVIVSWDQVAGAAGYAYRLNNTGNWTQVGASTLSVKLTNFPVKEKVAFSIKALGNPPISEDSEEYTEYIDLRTTSGLWVLFNSNDDPVELVETGTGTGIYSATISCPAKSSFYINNNNVKYGFMSFSGNGGVGTVNTTLAAVPFYNNGTYYVRESTGLISTGSEINNFYTNVNAACKVFVQVNMNNAIPTYYLKLVDTNDASIVLAQYFDLMAYGGDWATAAKGTRYDGDISTDGGYAGGTPNTNAATAFGVLFLDNASTLEAGNNRGLRDWTYAYVYEFAGYVRLSHTTEGQYGMLTTPKLNTTGKLEVTFDGMLFAGFRDVPNGYITVKVLNGGTITSAQVVKDGSGSPIAIQPAGNDEIHIIRDYHTDYENAAVKKWSNYTFVIEGATADTRIIWNCSGSPAKSKDCRYCIDNIVVKKK